MSIASNAPTYAPGGPPEVAPGAGARVVPESNIKVAGQKSKARRGGHVVPKWDTAGRQILKIAL